MRLTPRLFAALRKRRSIEHERQEFLLALINRNVVDFSMCRPKDSPKVTDFMPSRWGKDNDEEMSEDAHVGRIRACVQRMSSVNG